MSRWTTIRRAYALAAAFGLALLCAAPATAQQPVGSWLFDEGSGLVARDSGPFHLDGTLSTGGPDWIAGIQGTALHFDGSDQVALPDEDALEPQRMTVAAWVRGTGSPGPFRYVLSKGASSCDRSSYGLYTGSGGGAAFYIAGDGLYTVSPQAAASSVWDGRWHRLTGAYDGARVRVFVDGVQVGDGTPAPTHIEYGLESRAPYVGVYRGGCDLAFRGDIDEVRIWSAALTTAEVAGDAVPPPETPSSGPIGPAPGTGSSGRPAAKGKSVTPPGCTSVIVSRRSVLVARRSAIVATVRRGSTRVRGARVLLKSRKLRKVARTDARGRARFVVRASRRHMRLTIKVVTRKRARCGTPVAYVRVREQRAS